MGSADGVMVDNSLLDQRRLDKKTQKRPTEDKKDADFVNALHATCNVPGLCIEDQLDVFTIQTCRQPLSMFSFFREHESMAVDIENNEVPMLPVGAYALPTECEYCHAKSTRRCPAHCSRPKLYLQKKRPPFARRDESKWDKETDHAVDPHAVDHAAMDKSLLEEDTPQMISTDSSNASEEEPVDSQLFPSNDRNDNYDSNNHWLGIWSGSD